MQFVDVAHALFGWTKASSAIEVLLLFNVAFWACVLAVVIAARILDGPRL